MKEYEQSQSPNTVENELNYDWNGQMDRMALAETLNDAYNERQTLRNDKLYSKISLFYSHTKPIRVLLLVLSLVIVAFERPTWCQNKLHQTYIPDKSPHNLYELNSQQESMQSPIITANCTYNLKDNYYYSK